MRLLLAPLLFVALGGAAPADDIRTGVQADRDYLVALYKHLHQNPELSFEEKATAARVASEVKKLGFEVTTGVGRTGVVAVMKNGPGPVVMIRTDMDALPVQEDTGLPYASKAAAKMHACGHDIHMASWVGTARRLAAMKANWSGTLVMIAQPAEELGSGSKAMLDDGLFTRFPKPDHVLALHDNAALPAGTIGFASGYVMANVDSVDLTVKGVGGHGAYPHTTKDPVVLAARIITALQTLVAREIDPQSPGVVTVGSIHGGTKHNIVPDEVKLQLTVRSYTDETRKLLLDGIRRIAEGEAIAAGMPKDRMPVMSLKDDFTPATFNSEALTAKLRDVFVARFGEERVVPHKPTMGGEDFGRFRLADPKIQSMLFWLGAVDPQKYAAAKASGTPLPSLHSSKYAPAPEPTITTGVEAMTAAALALMAKGAS